MYMVKDTDISTEKIRGLLAGVMDPEVPVLSVLDLGIVRAIRVDAHDEGSPEIVITPTYSGCPAMDAIRTQIRMTLLQNGFENARVTTVLSPAWTTDWMSEEGKEKLKAYGIAPPTPLQQVCHTKLFHRDEAIACPRCGSYHTTLISEFGSTACKALYRCESCKEPFDYFKCH